MRLVTLPTYLLAGYQTRTDLHAKDNEPSSLSSYRSLFADDSSTGTWKICETAEAWIFISSKLTEFWGNVCIRTSYRSIFKPIFEYEWQVLQWLPEPFVILWITASATNLIQLESPASAELRRNRRKVDSFAFLFASSFAARNGWYLRWHRLRVSQRLIVRGRFNLSGPREPFSSSCIRASNAAPGSEGSSGNRR